MVLNLNLLSLLFVFDSPIKKALLFIATTYILFFLHGYLFRVLVISV